VLESGAPFQFIDHAVIDVPIKGQIKLNLSKNGKISRSLSKKELPKKERKVAVYKPSLELTFQKHSKKFALMAKGAKFLPIIIGKSMEIYVFLVLLIKVSLINAVIASRQCKHKES